MVLRHLLTSTGDRYEKKWFEKIIIGEHTMPRELQGTCCLYLVFSEFCLQMLMYHCSSNNF